MYEADPSAFMDITQGTLRERRGEERREGKEEKERGEEEREERKRGKEEREKERTSSIPSARCLRLILNMLLQHEER